MTEINAGWSLYPVCYLPGQSTMEISMTSGQFNAELFALANGRNFEESETYKTFYTEHLTPDATSHAVTLKYTPTANSVSVANMEEGTAAAEPTEESKGKFKVEDKAVTFPESVTGEVEISYEYTVASANVIEVDNKTSAIGEAVFKWPVYNAGQDCTESSIKGYVIMHLYRCRVTQMPKHNWAYHL